MHENISTQALIASHNSLEHVVQGLDQTLIQSTICSPEDASTRFSPRGCRMIPLPPDLRRQPNQTVPARPKEVTARQWRSFHNVYFQRKRNLEGHASGLCRGWFAPVFLSCFFGGFKISHSASTLPPGTFACAVENTRQGGAGFRNACQSHPPTSPTSYLYFHLD